MSLIGGSPERLADVDVVAQAPRASAAANAADVRLN
jgi:hypothetical protein